MNSNLFASITQIIKDSWEPPLNSFDEVYPRILLGDSEIAKDVMQLHQLGVTHVLNAAMGDDEERYVNTSVVYYHEKDFPCIFLGIPAMDLTAFQLHPYFRQASDFIHDALTLTSGGKVLVHCLQGLSRSATLVIAYLKIMKHFSVLDAVKLVRDNRAIYPNEGFILQLCDLESS